jgi:hypothetical protein
MRRHVIISFIALVAAGETTAALMLDDLPFFGIAGDYHERRGFLDFGSGHIEELARAGFPAVGISFGKRWRLATWARLQLSVTGKYGSVVDDTLPLILLSDNTWQTTLLRMSFFYGGAIADFQVPFRIAPDGQLFLHAGAGAHVANAWETEVLQADASQRISNDPYLEEHTVYSVSVHGGVGFEIAVSERFGIGIAYSLRYWHPISYAMHRDFFPLTSVDYHERFLSHELDIIVLAKR